MLGILLALTPSGEADPCGMVPPIHISGDVPTIERSGAQRTYVSHRVIPGVGGMETMALRPGFVGNVEDFGMLIPFPSPPAIRKIDDQTFAHIEAAVDPPEVSVTVIDPQPMLASRSRASWGMSKSAAPADSFAMEEALGYTEVRVLREEAVGMYEVAVLEAGSPKALERWMADNDYQYPDGMDDTVRDYVKERWCFVAIKAKVGGADGATPKPGMRTADTTRPAGSTFDGHVQGMAFRFWSDEPVVPMRLSVFNGEDPRNVVYVLADQPLTIEGVDDSMVVRQLQGEELHGHLTDLVDVNWAGGNEDDISEASRAQVAAARAPAQYNGIAAELFTADLLAARSGTLILPFEEEEKELLNISEAFGLRGTEIDGLHAAAVDQARSRAATGALDDVREMHLSVLDGVFPGELLAAQNLSFETFVMSARLNTERSEAIRPPGQNLSFWRGQ